MKIGRSFKYPENIPESPGIQEQVSMICAIESLLEYKLNELDASVKKFQQLCIHTWADVKKYDPDYGSCLDDIRGKDIFIGLRCEKCELFVPRREGQPWQVCFLCGDEMEKIGVIPGQVGRIHIDRCKKCGHEYGTT